MFIPDSDKQQMAHDFKMCRRAQLKHLVRLRELASDIRENAGKMAMFWKEAGEATGYSSETIRHKVGDLREYSDATLTDWIRMGVTFEQIKDMNELSSMDMLNAAPAKLLQDVYELGGATGKPMTTDELFEHATSHNPYAQEEYKINRWIYKSPALVKLTRERQGEFTSRLKALVQEFSMEMK